MNSSTCLAALMFLAALLPGCRSTDVPASCADFDPIVRSLETLQLAEGWSRLSAAEVQRVWHRPVVVATDDLLIFEQSPATERCGCFQTLHLHSEMLQSVTIARREPDFETARHHAERILAVVRPEGAEEIAVGPEDFRTYRWQLADEGRSRRQLGLDMEITRCGSGWHLRAVVSLFRTTRAADPTAQ